MLDGGGNTQTYFGAISLSLLVSYCLDCLDRANETTQYHKISYYSRHEK